MIDTTTSFRSQPAGSNKKKSAMMIVVIVVILALIGGYFMFRQTGNTDKIEEPVAGKTSSTPTPTKKPEIDKKSVKIQVLNGTGTPGQAASAVEALTKAGYEADNIKTGNAEDFDNSNTSISAKEGFEDVASDIKEALKGTFTDVLIELSEIDKDGEFDIVVITGGKKFEEDTPTPSIKPTIASLSPTPEATTATPTLSPSPSPTPTPTPIPTP